MTRLEQFIENAKAMPKKEGRADFIAHLEGKRLTRNEAIRAKCYECYGGEDQGTCTSPICALTPFCPWNRQKDTTPPRQ